MRAAERKHYQDLIIQHKSNAKKSWQIIKMIINKWKYTPANTKFKCKDSVIEDGKLIFDEFNIVFVNVGPTLPKKIEHRSILFLMVLSIEFI